MGLLDSITSVLSNQEGGQGGSKVDVLNAQGQQCQQTQHHRDDSFCLFHVPFLSPGTALIAFSRTEDYNMGLHRRHRLFFVLLYHTRWYCQNKSAHKIHAL